MKSMNRIEDKRIQRGVETPAERELGAWFDWLASQEKIRIAAWWRDKNLEAGWLGSPMPTHSISLSNEDRQDD